MAEKRYWFRNDYSFGMHKEVLNAISECNLKGNLGYGCDGYTKEAKELIKEMCALPESEVEFMVGGTQTNAIACAFLLKPWEAAVCPDSGHLNGHEVGAFEATGHKILTVKAGVDGKIYPSLIEPLLKIHKDEHLTKPKLVYISDSTENGEVYTKKELNELYDFCKENGLYLFVDGARLGCALTSYKNDMTLKEFAHLTDAFYIGGTKNGAPFGEALVFRNKDLADDFFRMKKRMGAVMEKGYIQGAIFLALLKNGLYFDMAKNSNEKASKLQDGLKKLGYHLWLESPTNQIFTIIPNDKNKKLHDICECEDWCDYDENSKVVRFVTCFMTTDSDVKNFLSDLKNI